ncbi:hypothetical protein CROQUDRAFT_652639 [Cronartium quercuum f. sp. fusiforme G11]|uniref:Uncharacterized protein n=1 Tax=Cronartium quercuum f. sp. fusiforme G11 TaxID=708437 RepID=A0A9P6TGX3_9BASI|nr:hypothetical protein CROQUDRAFT_652639 [Cronartium quercuum f. sp. fusiforme G11]
MSVLPSSILMVERNSSSEWAGLATSALPVVSPNGSSPHSLSPSEQCEKNRALIWGRTSDSFPTSPFPQDSERVTNENKSLANDMDVHLQVSIDHEAKKLGKRRLSFRTYLGLAYAIKKMLKNVKSTEDWVDTAHAVTEELASIGNTAVDDVHSDSIVQMTHFQARRFLFQLNFNRDTDQCLEAAVQREARRLTSWRVNDSILEGLTYLLRHFLETFNSQHDWIHTLHYMTQCLKAARDEVPFVPSLSMARYLPIDQWSRSLFEGEDTDKELEAVLMWQAKQLQLPSMPNNSCAGLAHIIRESLHRLNLHQNWIKQVSNIVEGFKRLRDPCDNVDSAVSEDQAHMLDMINALSVNLDWVNSMEDVFVSKRGLHSTITRQAIRLKLLQIPSTSMVGLIDMVQHCLLRFNQQEDWIDSVSHVVASIKARQDADLHQTSPVKPANVLSETVATASHKVDDTPRAINRSSIGQASPDMPIQAQTRQTCDTTLDVRSANVQMMDADSQPHPDRQLSGGGLKRARDDDDELTDMIKQEAKRLRSSPLPGSSGERLAETIKECLTRLSASDDLFDTLQRVIEDKRGGRPTRVSFGIQTAQTSEISPVSSTAGPAATFDMAGKSVEAPTADKNRIGDRAPHLTQVTSTGASATRVDQTNNLQGTPTDVNHSSTTPITQTRQEDMTHNTRQSVSHTTQGKIAPFIKPANHSHSATVASDPVSNPAKNSTSSKEINESYPIKTCSTQVSQSGSKKRKSETSELPSVRRPSSASSSPLSSRSSDRPQEELSAQPLRNHPVRIKIKNVNTASARPADFHGQASSSTQNELSPVSKSSDRFASTVIPDSEVDESEDQQTKKRRKKNSSQRIKQPRAAIASQSQITQKTRNQSKSDSGGSEIIVMKKGETSTQKSPNNQDRSSSPLSESSLPDCSAEYLFSKMI